MCLGGIGQDECRGQAGKTSRVEGEISEEEERALQKGIERKNHQILTVVALSRKFKKIQSRLEKTSRMRIVSGGFLTGPRVD